MLEDPRTFVIVGALLVYALVSRRLVTWWISMPAAMLILGIAAGPLGLGWLGADPEAEPVKLAAELTLALMLFHDAVRIDLRALRSGFSVPLRLLGIGLPLMVLIGTGVGYLLFPHLGWVAVALIATMLAPTDAALGDAVVSDERVPVRIRQGLSIESGLNDGLSVPIFLVLLGIAIDPSSVYRGVLLAELARQIGYGVLSGVLVGGVGGLLFASADKRGAMEPAWRLIAVALLAFGSFVGAAVMGGSGFIGAFVGGIAFGLASEARSAHDNELVEYLGTAFDGLAFLLLGAVILPFVGKVFDWRMVLYAILSLVAIRMVTVVVAMLGTGARWQTVAFMGWFGPRGLATLVFSVLVLDANIPDGNVIAATAVVGVVMSVFAHGLSAPPLVAAYARWFDAAEKDGSGAMESVPVHEHRLGMLSRGRPRG